MKLYILRHGDSVNANSDDERILTEKGIMETEKVGIFLSHKNITVDTIYHSVKKRAYQTASIISKYITSINGLKEENGLKPNDNFLIWVDKVNKINNDIMIVGHLPFLNYFVSYLLGFQNTKVVDIPASGLICLERNEENKMQIAWMIIPDLIP